MKRQLSKFPVSFMVIACLVMATLFISSVYDGNAYADTTPPQASLSNSKITVPDNMIAHTKFTITLTGDRQTNPGSVEGETRYIPYSYVVTHSNGTIKSPVPLKPNSNGIYSYSINFTDPGNKTIEVTWLQQKYQSGKWTSGTKGKTKKTIAIKGTLKFNANKGSVKTKSLVLKQKGKIGTLPKPTRSGYTFKGWYTKKTGGSKIANTTKIKFTSGTKTVYARWSAIKGTYKVTLNANGGTSSKTAMYVIKGKKYANYETLPSPTRTNYNFTGWYTAKTGGSKISGSTIVSKTSAHTLYARWKNQYTVTLDANGGTVKAAEKTKTVTLAKTYGALPTPTRTGYAFSGWYTDKTNGTKILSSSTFSLKNDQTLYARWTANGTANASVNGWTISSYDQTAKTIIAKIGKQAPSQCSVYSMAYCTAIKDKKQVKPSIYWDNGMAQWYLGGMSRLDYSTASNPHTKAMSVIKGQIDKNLPCIIRCTYKTAGGALGQHWVTVVGYKSGATIYSDLYILDPAATDPTKVYLFWDTNYYFPADGYVGVTTY